MFHLGLKLPFYSKQDVLVDDTLLCTNVLLQKKKCYEVDPCKTIIRYTGVGPANETQNCIRNDQKFPYNWVR